MEYGARTLFKIDDLKIYTEDKIGIVGPNGAGKTTLIKILCEEVLPTSGSIDIRGSYVYVPQLGEAEDGVLSEISQKEWKVPKDPKSGGEITRKKIAEAFSKASDILLCDEPTSNLDEDGIKLLENTLQSYGGTILLISHDRALLDTVCNRIWEIEDGEFTEYNGNYTEYRRQKELSRKAAWDEYEKYATEKSHLEQAARNRSSKAKSMKNPPKRMGNSEARLHRQDVRQRAGKVEQASTQIKRRLERLEEKEKPKEELSFKMRAVISENYVSKTAVEVKDLSFAYGENEVLYDVSFSVKRGEKVAIAGDNGSGKSTLLNLIAEGHKSTRVASGANVGYFRQECAGLAENLTALDNVKKHSMLPEHMIRTVLGRLGIRRQDVFKKVSVLSGGERCKVSLASLICGGYSILLLDEPTNYLDIYVLEALEEMLSEFDGTIILVSHDRYFRNKITNRQLVLKGGVLQSTEKPKPQKKSDMEKMLLEMEKADLITRLSFPRKGDVKEEVEKRYKEVCSILMN